MDKSAWHRNSYLLADRRRTGRRHPRLREAADASSTCPRITARGKGIRAKDWKVNDPSPWLWLFEDGGGQLAVGEGAPGREQRGAERRAAPRLRLERC